MATNARTEDKDETEISSSFDSSLHCSRGLRYYRYGQRLEKLAFDACQRVKINSPFYIKTLLKLEFRYHQTEVSLTNFEEMVPNQDCYRNISFRLD